MVESFFLFLAYVLPTSALGAVLAGVAFRKKLKNRSGLKFRAFLFLTTWFLSSWIGIIIGKARIEATLGGIGFLLLSLGIAIVLATLVSELGMFTRANKGQDGSVGNRSSAPEAVQAAGRTLNGRLKTPIRRIWFLMSVITGVCATLMVLRRSPDEFQLLWEFNPQAGAVERRGVGWSIDAACVERSFFWDRKRVLDKLDSIDYFGGGTPDRNSVLSTYEFDKVMGTRAEGLTLNPDVYAKVTKAFEMSDVLCVTETCTESLSSADFRILIERCGSSVEMELVKVAFRGESLAERERPLFLMLLAVTIALGALAFLATEIGVALSALYRATLGRLFRWISTGA